MATSNSHSNFYADTHIPADFLSHRIESHKISDAEFLDQQCSEFVLTKIAKKFIHWKTASAYLKIEKHELDEIEKDNRDERSRKKAILDKWRMKNGENATYLCLIDALYQDDDKELIDEVLNLLQQESELSADESSGVESDHSSGDILTENEVRSLCGCGKCTLHKYLTHGCPNPTEKKEYPLLEMKKLNKKMKAQLMSKLEKDTESIIEKFASLNRHVTMSLCNKCTVDDLILYITNLQLTRFMPQERNEIFSAGLDTCDTVTKVMKFLSVNFISWFNHSLLGSITKEYKVCREEYTEYVEQVLKAFLKKSLFEIPRNSFSSTSPKSEEKFMLKVDLPLSNRHLKASKIYSLIQQHIAETLGITVSSFEMCAYDKGCIEITVGAPAQLLQATFKELEENSDLLIDLGSLVVEPQNMKIISITYNDKTHKTIYRRECKKTFKSDDWNDWHTTALSEIDECFAGLVVLAAQFHLEELIGALRNLSTHKLYESSEDFFTNDMKEVLEAKSTSNLIRVLSSYWSFVSFKLLEYLLLKLKPSLEDKICGYISLLSKLKISYLPVLLHPACQLNRFCQKPVILEMTQHFIQDETVDKLLGILDAIVITFHLEPQSVLIKSIKKANDEIHLLFVNNAVQSIARALKSSIVHLIDKNINQIHFDGKKFPILAEKETLEHFQGGNVEEANLQLQENQLLSSLMIAAKALPSKKNMVAESKPVGVLKICELCYSTGYSNVELCEYVCLKPFQHSQTKKIFSTWDSRQNCLKQINPRPQIPNNENFVLCSRLPTCDGKNCTDAHSILERDAWNYDLSKENSIITLAPVKKTNDLSKFKNRKDWFKAYKLQLQKALGRNRIIIDDCVLSASNYRSKFYHSLCLEESEHITLLSEKCDGTYKFMFGEKFWKSEKGEFQTGILKEMTQDQLHYAAQASSSIYFVDPKTNQDVCEAYISFENFKSLSDEFKIEISIQDCQMLKQFLKKSDGLYLASVEFDLKHSYFEKLHRAVCNIPDSAIFKIMLKQNYTAEQIMIREISPKCEHEKLEVDDVGQLQALQAIIHQPSYMPIVISGPFGSGKTRVIARAVYETVMDSVKSNKVVKILVSAHHYDTTDTYEDYFVHSFQRQRNVKVIKILREMDHSFQYAYNYPNTITRLSPFMFREYVEQGMYDADKCSIVLATYSSSSKFVNCLNEKKSRQFTHVFLDEAAQIREPEVIGSLCATNSETRIVIAGDTKQVGPHEVVLIKDEVLQKSLMERLEDEYVKRKLIGRYLVKLGRNYRCHKKLTKLLCKTMYEYPIEPKQVEKSDHPDFPNSPCVFHCYDVDESTSQLNASSEIKMMEHEADAVIEQLENFLWYWPDTDSWNKYTYNDICVISSNRTQLNMIDKKLRKNNSPFAGQIRLMPSFTIQGHEFQAVFLCTADYKDLKGFITNPIKSLLTPGIFNTVLSRSRSLVVAVGNPFTLLNSEDKSEYQQKCWREYLELCLLDNSVTFPEKISDTEVESIRAKLANRIGIRIGQSPPSKSTSDPVSSVQKEGPSFKKSLSYPDSGDQYHSRRKQKGGDSRSSSAKRFTKHKPRVRPRRV